MITGPGRQKRRNRRVRRGTVDDHDMPAKIGVLGNPGKRFAQHRRGVIDRKNDGDVAVYPRHAPVRRKNALVKGACGPDQRVQPQRAHHRRAMQKRGLPHPSHDRRSATPQVNDQIAPKPKLAAGALTFARAHQRHVNFPALQMQAQAHQCRPPFGNWVVNRKSPGLAADRGIIDVLTWQPALGPRLRPQCSHRHRVGNRPAFDRQSAARANRTINEPQPRAFRVHQGLRPALGAQMARAVSKIGAPENFHWARSDRQFGLGPVALTKG